MCVRLWERACSLLNARAFAGEKKAGCGDCRIETKKNDEGNFNSAHLVLQFFLW